MAEPINKTAEQYRAEAQMWREKEAESFERCDTDGFVSQWCHRLSASEADAKARIAEAGGRDEFWGLFTLDGERVAAKLIDTRFGTTWALCDSPDPRTSSFTGKFVRFVGGDPSEWCGTRDEAGNWVPDASAHRGFLRRTANLAKKGFREQLESVPANAKVHGEGRGLSGLATARVITYRTDGGYPKGSKVVR